jgi:hypothetical protein
MPLPVNQGDIRHAMHEGGIVQVESEGSWQHITIHHSFFSACTDERNLRLGGAKQPKK